MHEGHDHAPADQGARWRHILHRAAMAPITEGTKHDRMQYELPHTAAHPRHDAQAGLAAGGDPTPRLESAGPQFVEVLQAVVIIAVAVSVPEVRRLIRAQRKRD